jgi:hypothetical protein
MSVRLTRSQSVSLIRRGKEASAHCHELSSISPLGVADSLDTIEHRIPISPERATKQWRS